MFELFRRFLIKFGKNSDFTRIQSNVIGAKLFSNQKIEFHSLFWSKWSLGLVRSANKRRRKQVCTGCESSDWLSSSLQLACGVFYEPLTCNQFRWLFDDLHMVVHGVAHKFQRRPRSLSFGCDSQSIGGQSGFDHIPRNVTANNSEIPKSKHQACTLFKMARLKVNWTVPDNSLRLAICTATAI